jgi:predicted  nucleic acid-binding Zn-ribbon protein
VIQIEELETAVAATQKSCSAAVAAQAKQGKSQIEAMTTCNKSLEDDIADLKMRMEKTEADIASVTDAAKDSRQTFRSSRKEKESEMATLQATVGPASASTPQKPKDEFNRLLSEMEGLVAGEIKTQ